MQKEHDEADYQLSIEQLKNNFVSMQVKRQLYRGRPALALYIRDKTKRVREKLYRMKRQEEFQQS